MREALVGRSRTWAILSVPSRNSAAALGNAAALASTTDFVVPLAAVLAMEERKIALLGMLLRVHLRRDRVLRHRAAALEEALQGIMLDAVRQLCVLPRRLGCAEGSFASGLRAHVPPWRRKRLRREVGARISAAKRLAAPIDDAPHRLACDAELNAVRLLGLRQSLGNFSVLIRRAARDAQSCVSLGNDP